jgi:hypothetical protein
MGISASGGAEEQRNSDGSSAVPCGLPEYNVTRSFVLLFPAIAERSVAIRNFVPTPIRAWRAESHHNPTRFVRGRAQRFGAAPRTPCQINVDCDSPQREDSLEHHRARALDSRLLTRYPLYTSLGHYASDI